MDERARRIGENEALFRLVNERMEGLNEAFGTITETMSVVCECGNISCAEQIEIGIGEYERVRSDPTLFVVLPGHEVADVEDVVDRRDGFNVVRKRAGDAVDAAIETDPRA